jgi:hypothetical protein
MKTVLFILLVFISFQGFSQIQSVKLKELGIEVMTKDLGWRMTWNEAIKACADLGDGWRLPTKIELAIMCEKQNLIGGFKVLGYWSSTEDDRNCAWYLYFHENKDASYRDKANTFSVRPVRTLK